MYKYLLLGSLLEKMIIKTMETKVWFFLHRYGKVEQLFDELDTIKPFIVSDETQKYAVFVFDWNKSVGSNTIIRTEERTRKINCDGAIIVANRFSSIASEMVEYLNKSEKEKFFLFTQKEVDQILIISQQAKLISHSYLV